MDYLAVDFGTTNSLAAVLSYSREFQLIPLEAGVQSMPSAVFLKLRESTDVPISDEQFSARYNKALEAEDERRRKQESEVLNRLQTFQNENAPKVKKPKRSDYQMGFAFDNKRFMRDMERYLLDQALLPTRLKNFTQNELECERVRLRNEIVNVRSDEEVANFVRFNLDRERLEVRSAELREFSFFTAIDDPRFVPLIGAAAIEAYRTDPLDGFYMRSPKAFLAANLIPAHQHLFSRIVSLILTQIKRRAEEFTNCRFDGIVLGRPAQYMGANFGAGNAQALRIMRNAARMSGFTEVRFVKEPLAVALVIQREWYDSDNPALVVDVGGGTTDVAYVKVDNNSDSKVQVAAVTGERIGGNDFDQSIAMAHIGPFLGIGTNLKDGLPFPLEYVHLALSTRDLVAQSKFQRSGNELASLAKKTVDSNVGSRLLQIFRDQLQHRVLLTAEEIKFAFAKDSSFTSRLEFALSYFEAPTVLHLLEEEINASCLKEIDRIKRIVRQCLDLADNGDRPVRIFLTGGMSLFPKVVDAIDEIKPPKSIMYRIDSLVSVIGGLSVVARELSQAESLYFEPKSFRGIPVEIFSD
jgi:hypothetical chaperone protein